MIPFSSRVPVQKRCFDLLLSFFGLILLSPILVLIALVVRVKLGYPVIFKQERPGKDEKIFTLYKFRSMRDSHDVNGNVLPDEKRLTTFGALLRSSSLDELPELVNVLRGDMSLVGPRPLLVSYLNRYSSEQHRRHAVLPGITGWAQVNGRNAITWEEKFKLDVWYVDNWTFLLDLKILFLTVKKVFLREGIAHPGEVTMEEFRGKNSDTYSDTM
jgi:lipopolysaccharide/colanic/teichoic acid biosynthesis glycosyltransferase